MKKILFILSFIFMLSLASSLTININETGYFNNGTFILSNNPLGEASNLTIDGDILNISQGNYTTQLFINKSISIIGAGYDQTFINLPKNADSLSGGSDHVTAGILIYSPNYSNPSVNVHVAGLTLNGNYTTNKWVAGVFVYSANATIDSIVIKNYRLGNKTSMNLSKDVTQYGVLIDRL